MDFCAVKEVNGGAFLLVINKLWFGGRVGREFAMEMSTMNPILISRRICHRSVRLSRRFFGLTGLAAALALGCNSCSTTKGFGQDLQKVGDKIESEAVKTGGTQ